VRGEAAMDRFKLIKKLGRGSYGSALLAERLSSKGLVVIKRVDMSEMDEPEKKQVRSVQRLAGGVAGRAVAMAHRPGCDRAGRRLGPRNAARAHARLAASRAAAVTCGCEPPPSVCRAVPRRR